MMGGMFKDVFDFLMLLILVLLGFTGALTTLFASDLDIEDYPGYIEVADSDCFVMCSWDATPPSTRCVHRSSLSPEYTAVDQ